MCSKCTEINKLCFKNENQVVSVALKTNVEIPLCKTIFCGGNYQEAENVNIGDFWMYKNQNVLYAAILKSTRVVNRVVATQVEGNFY